MAPNNFQASTKQIDLFIEEFVSKARSVFYRGHAANGQILLGSNRKGFFLESVNGGFRHVALSFSHRGLHFFLLALKRPAPEKDAQARRLSGPGRNQQAKGWFAAKGGCHVRFSVSFADREGDVGSDDVDEFEDLLSADGEVKRVLGEMALDGIPTSSGASMSVQILDRGGRSLATVGLTLT
ncbi:DUF6894 family protein [Pararhizobium qamdonense]|uniref:DUF6894 family protein n=1 Tax=Pararhizobium qamdonense TaxID=3031126 RepID=UPI0023E18D23|nr:hypothetical protein [Pararhizobium qamdonense]